MFTEDEAKTKWCPFARVQAAVALRGQASFHGAAFNRLAIEPALEIDTNPINSRCIASECMAWRWAQKRNPDWQPDHSGQMWPSPHPDDGSPLYVTDHERGHCGLASKG